jgi:hypothetical protein
MSYDDLYSKAQQIVDLAMEYDLRDKGYYKDGDHYIDSSGYRTQEEVDADMKDVSTKYADVPTLFAPFCDLPNPSSYDYEINQLGDSQGKLSSGTKNDDPVSSSFYPANTVLDNMDTTQDYIARWTGVAAMAFKENFVDKFESVTQNQFLLTGVVKGALQAEQGIWFAARKDIEEIADKTINGIKHADDCGKNDWTLAFAIVGAVVAIAAVPVTGGASAFALAAVGAGLSVGGTAIGNMDDPPSDNSYSGESAEAVVNSMRKGISSLKEKISHQEQKIQDAMSSNADMVSAHPDLFELPRPNLADANAGNVTDDFGDAR